jgi:hypothetical protein
MQAPCPSIIPHLSAITQLSADGSSLPFSSYVNGCGPPAIAASTEGIVFAGVNLNHHAEVEAFRTGPRSHQPPPLRH